MKITKDMIERLKSVAEDLFYEYEVVSIRVQEQDFQIGEISHKSKVWIDGEETEEELNGICAIKSDCADKVFNSSSQTQYHGSHVAIIAGNNYEFGEDLGEVVISDPVVVEVLA